MRLSYWFPVVVLMIGIAILFSYALTPLPANPYGRTVYDVHTTLSVPPDSSLSILIGDEQRIPGASFILITAGVLNDKPGSDIQDDAYFRLEHAGSTLEDGTGSGLSLSFEASGATEGRNNPQLVIRNDHPMPLEVEYRAFVVRPPTVWEKFSTFVGGVIIATVLAAMWPLYTVTIGRREGERSA